jgi:hypothetical protein
MESVFISSLARGEMTAFRQAARDAVESLGMRPVMFETAAASEQDSRRTLLDKVPRCDALLLILGAEYGEPGPRGMSPTEEEFDQAVRNGVPVLAIVQDGVERDAAQQAFLSRVRGAWEDGRFAPTFRDEVDAMRTAVRALNEWRQRAPAGQLREEATSQALELARDGSRPGVMSSGSLLRVVLVPLTSRPMLDALTLEDSSLVDDLSTRARAAGLITNTMAIDPEIDRNDTIHLRTTQGHGWEQPHMRITRGGAVVAEGPVGGDERGSFSGSLVMADRVTEVIERSATFAESVWTRIDGTDEVRQVLVVVVVPGAQGKVYAVTEVSGNSMRLGGSFSMPDLLIAPEQPLLVRREDLGRPDFVAQLRAELRRRFAAEHAVHEG